MCNFTVFFNLLAVFIILKLPILVFIFPVILINAKNDLVNQYL